MLAMRRAAQLACVLAVACGSSDHSFDDGANHAAAPDASTPPAPPNPAAPGDDGGAPKNDGCTVGDEICLAADRRRACVANAAGSGWIEETCAAGSGCFQGVCKNSRCSDECTAGEQSAGRTCAPLDAATRTPVAMDPTTKGHDRARAYLAWLDKSGLLAGGVGDARYSDPPAYTNLTTMNGIGDSAIWTGTLLASQALRLRATGAPDARARVRDLVSTMHLWLNVSGQPGLLVRYAKESSKTFPFAIPDVDCNNQRVHCGVDHGGTKYDFVGHISRDQYQGLILGLALAYDALTSADEDLREIIRGDVVTFVKELMKERNLSLALTYNGIALPVTVVPVRFVVLDPREMSAGSATIQINSSASDKLGSLFGFQEFTPDLSDILKHIPGIGALGGLVPIPRASSAIMLASFFRVALRVTDGVPSWKKDHDDILAYYTGHSGEGGNVSNWLEVATQWSDGGGCGDSYYANNITMEPLYDLARLEDDPARLATVRNQILGQKLWPAFAATKNAFFSFIYAGVTPGEDAGIGASAAAQLAQFPAPPRVQAPVDLRSSSKYPNREPSCTDQVRHDGAVDVGDRVAADFLWQRQPWGLFDGGDQGQTHPGVDYLVAYFMGRYHGFVTDDTPGTCLVWQ
jgi:hypothetical protein